MVRVPLGPAVFDRHHSKEKVSGAKTDRPELAKAIGRLEPGDVLVVTRLDRLARSTRDLLNVLDHIGKRGAGFKSLKDAWADTTTAHGRLMLTVLAAAEPNWSNLKLTYNVAGRPSLNSRPTHPIPKSRSSSIFWTVARSC